MAESRGPKDFCFSVSCSAHLLTFGQAPSSCWLPSSNVKPVPLGPSVVTQNILHYRLLEPVWETLHLYPRHRVQRVESTPDFSNCAASQGWSGYSTRGECDLEGPRNPLHLYL